MTQISSPFYPDRPVPTGGLVGGQRAARRAITTLTHDIANAHGDPVLIFGSPGSGRTSLLNFVSSTATRAGLLVVDVDLNESVFDVEGDVAAAIVTSVVIALESAGMLADHPDRRRAWLAQCARVPVGAGVAEPLLLTPGNRSTFHAAALVRDLNVLADHVRSSDGSGLIIRHDDIDELPIEAKTVLTALVVHAGKAAGWSLALAATSRSPLQAEVRDSVELGPLTRVDIFRMAGEAAGDTQHPGAPSVLSREAAAAIVDATRGKASEIAFCLDRMWRASSVENTRRLQLSCEILRELLSARGASEEAEALPLLERIDHLEANDLFGLHFLATFEAMSEDQLSRLITVMSLAKSPDVPPDAEVIHLVLPPVDVLVERMCSQGLLERHEGRFTVLRDNAIARQYLTCLITQRHLPSLGTGQPTYTAVAAYHILRSLSQDLAPSGRMIAGKAQDLQRDDAEINLVDRISILADPSVEELLDLQLSSADSTFGFLELDRPCFLLAIRVRSCIDTELCIVDEELAMVTVVQCDGVADDLDAGVHAWLGENEDRLSAARLQVLQYSMVPIKGDRADQLRAVLAPSSVLATMFGAFFNQEFHQAARYTDHMLALAERLQRHRGSRAHTLPSLAPDLRSRLIFLNAIIGDQRRATELAEEVLTRSGHRAYWLDVYNNALLIGYRGEWILAAEALADLQRGDQREADKVYLLLHLPGLTLDSGRPPTARFADVAVRHLDEVVTAQRMSFEAMSGRYSNSDYLAHVHSLEVATAVRIAACTLATRYRDRDLAATLLEQVLESDPENRDTYIADLDFLTSSGSETHAEP